MKNKGYFDYAKYGSIGISWVLATSIYFYLGYKGGSYLDNRLGSEPVFLLIGLLGAVALSMRTLIGEIMSILTQSNASKESDSGNERSSSALNREKSNKKPQEPT